MTDLDRTLHEPARLRIMAMLSRVSEADFNFLLSALSLTKGNLSCHMDRLEKAGYIAVTKGFNGKIPFTTYRITDTGTNALDAYWSELDAIRGNGSGGARKRGEFR